MLESCRSQNIDLPTFIYKMEGPSLRPYLERIWEAMKTSVERGLAAEGILPGGLNVARKAKLLYEKRCYNESADVTMNRVIAAYAYAVSEENADENIVVTSPTCGSCGVSGKRDPGCSCCCRTCRQCDPHKRQYLRR